MISTFSVDNKKSETEETILTYLKKNPDAGDTLEGISRWWLESIKINKSVDDVAQALEGLVKKGIVAKSGVKTETSVYKIS